jgi:hypothetical protein
MINEYYDELLDAIGDDNMSFVSQSTRKIKGKEHTRGSVFVSPEGMANIRRLIEKWERQ